MYWPHRKQDLESFVRTIMYLYHELPHPPVLEDRIDVLAKKSILYWEFIDREIEKNQQDSFWSEALRITREHEHVKDRMNQLKVHLHKLRFRYFDNKDLRTSMEDYITDRFATLNI